MEGILKVTPERLLSGSEEFASLATVMSNLTGEMMTLVRNLKTVWQGDASEAFGNKFASLQTDMDKLYRMVEEHAQDLSEMARNYQEAENMNRESGSSLNSGIIS